MKIVAFLQNLWVLNPDRAQAVFDRFPEQREALLRRYLFRSSRTGTVLKAALGADWCRDIVWEESTRQISGNSRETFPPDPAHITAVLVKHQPTIVLAFGKLAANGCMQALMGLTFEGVRESFQSEFITGPHPAAIGKATGERLREIRALLDQRMGMTRISPITAN